MNLQHSDEVRAHTPASTASTRLGGLRNSALTILKNGRVSVCVC